MKLREATIDDYAFVEEHTAFPDHYQKEPIQTVFSVALEQDNNVITVGGIMMINANTAWAFCDITTFAEGHKIELVRNMRTYLDMMVEELKLSRLQVWVDPLRPEAIKLVKHLGFVKEYEMKDFLGKDKSAMMYVKLTEV